MFWWKSCIFGIFSLNFFLIPIKCCSYLNIFRPCQRLQALAWTKTTAVRLDRNSSTKTGTKEIAAVFEGGSSFIFVKKKDHTRNYNLIQGVTTYISSMCTEWRYTAISIFFRPCQRLQVLAWTKTTAVRLDRYSSNKSGPKESCFWRRSIY